MRIQVLRRFGQLAGLALLAGSTSLMATTTYSGSLPNPNALFEVQYTLTTTSNVTISTSGVPGGDFFPFLWLFNSTDTMQLDKNDPLALQDASMTEANQAPGTYDVILSAFDQHYCVANTICNGFVYGNTGWSYNGSFFARSPKFNVNISSASTFNSTACSEVPGNCINPSPTRAFPANTGAPEPTTAGLLVAGGVVIGWFRWRSRKSGLNSP